MSPSTHTQKALNAVVLLYKQFLNMELGCLVFQTRLKTFPIVLYHKEAADLARIM